MKIRIVTITFITFFLVGFLFQTKAQNITKTSNLKVLKKNIDSIFVKTFSYSTLKDSVAVYAINFKLEIIKNNKGKGVLNKIIATDSLGFKLFPAYKKLYSLNYSNWLNGKQKIYVIIPVLIYNISAKATSKYTRQDGKPLIDIETVSNAYSNSISSMIPNNNGWLNNVVLLEPYIVRILNIE